MPLNFGKQVPEPTIGKQLTKDERKRRRFRGDSKSIRRGLSELNDEDELLQEVEQRAIKMSQEGMAAAEAVSSNLKDSVLATEEFRQKFSEQFGRIPDHWRLFGADDVRGIREFRRTGRGSADSIHGVVTDRDRDPSLHLNYDQATMSLIATMVSVKPDGISIMSQYRITDEELAIADDETIIYSLNVMLRNLGDAYYGRQT